MRLPKCFYKEVTVTSDGAILLDGKAVKTPGKRPLKLPTQMLAEAIAEEWRGQGSHIDPATLLLTKLANTAIDRVGPDLARIIAEIVEFAGSDLVCYRAKTPDDLVNRQARSWDPVIAWALKSLDASFLVTTGVVHRRQADEAMSTLKAHISTLDPFTLTALHNMMTLTGSALLGAMVIARDITPDDAWTVAHVDEDFQIEQWGADEEATQRRERRRVEFISCASFARLVFRLA